MPTRRKFKAPRSGDSSNVRALITGLTTLCGTAALDTAIRHEQATARIAVVDGVLNLFLKAVALFAGLGAAVSVYR